MTDTLYMLTVFNNRDARQFAFVAKLSVLVSALALAAMTAVVLFITKDGSGNYLEQLLNIRLSHQRLMPMVVIAGLFLLAMAGFLTWLIVLYSSFRVAGPLFRFSSNIEMILERGLVTLVPIRRDDCFQEQSKGLNEAVTALQTHYSEVEQQLGALQQIINEQDLRSRESREQIAEIKQKLNEVDQQVNV